jgi:hypothetical protein
MIKLKDIFNNHTDRPSSKWKHYFDIYDRHLQHLIGQEFTLFEIGVAQGGSLQIWRKYFGDKVKIIGIDIEPKSIYNESQIITEQGNQADPNFLMSLIKTHGTPDVIIDDGSHIQTDILATFSVLYPQLNYNGVYIVEDCHTSYSPQWSGGITSPFNFITVVSRFIHDVNVEWIKEPYTPTIKNIKAMSFYDSLVVFEKEKENALPKEACFTNVTPKKAETPIANKPFQWR